MSRATAAILFPAIAMTVLWGVDEAWAADSYRADAVHSSVVFRVVHGGVGHVYGRFNEFDAEVSFDESNPADSAFNLTIRTQSVDTGAQRRDNHLRSPDFFNARQFPEIGFKSTAVEAAGDGKLRVSGDLTLHGVTRPIVLEVTHVGSRDLGRMGYRSGFAATFTVKRSDFGMTYMVDNGMVSDEVTLMVGLECVRQ